MAGTEHSHLAFEGMFIIAIETRPNITLGLRDIEGDWRHQMVVKLHYYCSQLAVLSVRLELTALIVASTQSCITGCHEHMRPDIHSGRRTGIRLTSNTFER